MEVEDRTTWEYHMAIWIFRLGLGALLESLTPSQFAVAQRVAAELRQQRYRLSRYQGHA